MLVAQQLRRKFGAAALQIAGFIMKSKFPLVVVRRRLWEFPTMACFEQWYKVKGEENCGTLKVSLLLIRSDQLVGVGQAHLSAPDDISHWFVAGAKLSGEIVQRLEAPIELSRYQLYVLGNACEDWRELRPSSEPTKHFELFDMLCNEQAVEQSQAFRKIAQFFPHRWRSE